MQQGNSGANGLFDIKDIEQALRNQIKYMAAYLLDMLFFCQFLCFDCL